ncbi:MAG: phosphoribosylamine--glycine ligase [Desulfovibrionaceae bacterium]|nr:phosphoribosylamine--glycine ligase [Desulfovibrionaceae bacterium]
MRVLIIGSGGREHALTYKLLQSPLVKKVYVAPGNGGTLADGAENVPIKANAIEELVAFAKDQKIDLVVPGPELPLTLGLTDACKAAHIKCFGPDKYAANLEGSKAFAKEIMAEAKVPTAKAKVVEDLKSAEDFLQQSSYPLVVKADGLAQGKGVVICENFSQALSTVKGMLSEEAFGAAGRKVLLEEFLEGEEASLLAFCDGQNCYPLPSSQDHKRAFDGDQGPNTGGMGAYSPAPILPDEDLEKVCDLTLRPVLKVLAKRGHPFVGVLYAGLMLTKTGPKVLEYDVRFGDPECQPLLLRLKSDLAPIMLSAIEGNLAKASLEFTSEAALGVVIAKEGYPASYAKGALISGIERAEKLPLVKVFHSGTELKNGQLLSTGGRILCVTCLGKDLSACQKTAYSAVQEIKIQESFYRKDIGAKGLAHLKA